MACQFWPIIFLSKNKNFIIIIIFLNTSGAEKKNKPEKKFCNEKDNKFPTI